jgi:hypothetical protein
MKHIFALTAVLMVAVPFLHPAEAHHSVAAMYRLDQRESIHGTVVQVIVREPHSLLLIEAPDDTGVMRRWSAERDDTASLSVDSVRLDTLRVGDRVRVQGNPARNAGVRRLLITELSRDTDE